MGILEGQIIEFLSRKKIKKCTIDIKIISKAFKKNLENIIEMFYVVEGYYIHYDYSFALKDVEFADNRYVKFTLSNLVICIFDIYSERELKVRENKFIIVDIYGE